MIKGLILQPISRKKKTWNEYTGNSDSDFLDFFQNTFKEKITSVLSAEFASIQKEIDSLSKKGEIQSIKAQDLMISIVSLNVFIFTVLPLASLLTDQQNLNIEKMLASRKAENVKTILARLNPKQ